MKKVMSLVLAIAMVFSLAVPAFAADAATLTLSADNSSVAPGEAVTLTLAVDKPMTNIGAMEYKVSYNADLFSLTDSAAGEAFADTKISDPSATSGNAFVRVWYTDTSLGDPFDISAGTIATLTFTANSQAADATGGFGLAVVELCDYDFEDFDYTIENTASSIVIAAPSADKYSIDFGEISNGTVLAKVNGTEAVKAAAGQLVELTVTPDRGYMLESLTYTPAAAEGEEPQTVDITDMSFEMPAADVTVDAVFAPVPAGYTVQMPADIENVVVTSQAENSAVSIPVTVDHTCNQDDDPDNDVDFFNSFDMTFTYDPDVLMLTSEDTEITDVKDTDGKSTGTVYVERYGEDIAAGATALTLNFKPVAAGETTVTCTAAKVGVTDTAHELDADPAVIQDDETVIKITGYGVRLDDDFEGESVVGPDEDYTFTAKDLLYDYEIKVEVELPDGTKEDISDQLDGEGTQTAPYTVPAEDIRGYIIITSEKSGRKFDVTITVEGDDVKDTDMVPAGVFKVGKGAAQYMNKAGYQAKLDPEDGYDYLVEITVNNEAYSCTPDSDNIYTVEGAAIKGDIEIRVTKTRQTAEAHKVEFTGNGVENIVEGTAADTAEHGKDYTFALNMAENEANGYVYTVTASMGGRETPVTRAEAANEDGSFTFTVKAVTADLVINIEKSDLQVTVHEYVALQDKTMFLVNATQTLPEGEALSYDGDTMFYSEQYGAWAYLVIVPETDEDGNPVSFDAAVAKAEITHGTVESYTTLEPTFNVNESNNDTVDINDAQLVFDMYNNEYQDFSVVNRQKFLRADVSSEEETLSYKKLDVSDAAAIVAEIIAAK